VATDPSHQAPDTPTPEAATARHATLQEGTAHSSLDGAQVGTIFGAIAAAADGADVGITVTLRRGAEPEHLYYNDAACRILGYERDELARIEPLSLVVPEDLQRMRANYSRRVQNESPTTNSSCTIVRKDGTRRQIMYAVANATLDGQPVMVGFFFDITDRRRTEADLSRSEERFRRLIQGAPDGIAIIIEGRIAFVNEVATRMFGVDKSALLLGEGILDWVHPAQRDQMQSRTQTVLDGGTLSPTEYRLQGADGVERIIEVASISIEFEGKPAILAIGRDVTTRKALEAQYLRNDRLAAVGRLAADVAHEVNNPLAYMRLNAEYLERCLPELAADPSLTTTLMARLAELRQGVDHVATIVGDLLRFSRAHDAAMSTVVVDDVVGAAVRMMRREIEPRADLVVHPGATIRAFANPQRLEQVLVNLLINAAQAVASKGQRGRVEVKTFDDEGQPCVEISDDGPGIPAEALPYVFDPFFTTKPVGQGTGLGLAISRNLVNGMGGRIDVESRPGEGATFRVLLAPVGSQASAHEVPEATLRPPARPRRRVLVVDDDEALRHMCARMLSQRDVQIFDDADEALSLLENSDGYDIVLLGSELARVER
jgi:PAS domain S-box-containing protein